MSPNSIISSSDSIHPENLSTKACEKKVLLLLGLPGAGKSSLARHFIEKRPHASSPTLSSVALIEYDDIQDSLLLDNKHHHDDQEQCDEEYRMLQAWRASRAAALQTLSERLDDSITTTILLDDNFHLTSMRKQIFQLCQSHVTENRICDTTTNNKKSESSGRIIHFGLIWMDTPVNVCLDRNRQRPQQRRVPHLVIQNMKLKFEPPGEKAFLWEQSFLRLDGTASLSTHLEQLLSFTSSSPEQLTLVPPPVDPGVEEARIAIARQETLASKTHQLDQYLRCCVQAVAKHHKQCVGAANQSRKQLLLELKQRQELVVIEDLEQAFLDQMREMTFSTLVDWGAFRPILHKDLLIKQSDLNGIGD